MGLIATKLVALFLLALLRLVLGLSPLLIVRTLLETHKKQVEMCVSLCLCLGGGVLLATCFIHLLPETRSTLAAAFLPAHRFPLAELLVCAGLFLVHLVDEMVVALASAAGNRVSPAASAAAKSEAAEVAAENCGAVTQSDERPARGIFVVLALSFHSFVEGLAIGLEETVSDVWFLFVAVLVHEGVILFSVGIDLVASGVAFAHAVVYITLLALVSPAGMLVGILFTGNEQTVDSHSITVAVVQGLTAGTLLYVTFFEVLTKERYERCSSGLLALLVSLLGFLLMLALQLIGIHDHKTHEPSQLDCPFIDSDQQVDLLEDLS
ncbi:zinc transporter ZIP1-like isoform X2 [Nilaparvata lugens]|uniref:zinc transporter ZIP1-like isoform X1 n=1 Tax=Nilaparvata lugens TaxID=108931 RepID=UPI00193DB6E2|nr:zinc transporter ZIP1-like isoform X1 [Nilaparvata lugens]XP_039276518.1 zinc transporter ZIP1-like isoform X2 [Nilaparvata lugens]